MPPFWAMTQWRIGTRDVVASPSKFFWANLDKIWFILDLGFRDLRPKLMLKLGQK